MDKELRSIRIGPPPISPKEIVTVVRQLYPRFDRPLLSKCEHGDEYGIQMRADALAELHREFAAPAVATAQEPSDASSPSRRPRDGHRLSCRISGRLEDGEYNTLVQFAKADGYATMQDWIKSRVRLYILEKRGAT